MSRSFAFPRTPFNQRFLLQQCYMAFIFLVPRPVTCIPVTDVRNRKSITSSRHDLFICVTQSWKSTHAHTHTQYECVCFGRILSKPLVFMVFAIWFYSTCNLSYVRARSRVENKLSLHIRTSKYQNSWSCATLSALFEVEVLWRKYVWQDHFQQQQ